MNCLISRIEAFSGVIWEKIDLIWNIFLEQNRGFVDPSEKRSGS